MYFVKYPTNVQKQNRWGRMTAERIRCSSLSDDTATAATNVLSPLQVWIICISISVLYHLQYIYISLCSHSTSSAINFYFSVINEETRLSTDNEYLPTAAASATDNLLETSEQTNWLALHCRKRRGNSSIYFISFVILSSLLLVSQELRQWNALSIL